MNTAAAQKRTASGVSPDPMGNHSVAVSPAHPRVQVRAAVADSCLLALSCLVSYWLATTILVLAHSPSRADDLLGGMWAAIATVMPEIGVTAALSAGTVAAALLLGAGTVAAAPLFTLRRLHRIDVPSTLRVAE